VDNKNARVSTAQDREKSLSQASIKPATAGLLLMYLKKFGLQQYHKKLCAEEMSNRPEILLGLRADEVEALFDRIKVFPGHRVKFRSMLDVMREEASRGILRGRSNTALTAAEFRSISPPTIPNRLSIDNMHQRRASIETPSDIDLDEFVFP
jgi:hypothetical protein